MALQAILVRAGEALPADTMIVELAVSGEIAEAALRPRPTVTARIPIAPDARVTISDADMSAYLLGRALEGPGFEHGPGDRAVTQQFLRALGAD
jgi:hypothetical protein